MCVCVCVCATGADGGGEATTERAARRLDRSQLLDAADVRRLVRGAVGGRQGDRAGVDGRRAGVTVAGRVRSA